MESSRCLLESGAVLFSSTVPDFSMVSDNINSSRDYTQSDQTNFSLHVFENVVKKMDANSLKPTKKDKTEKSP